MKNRFEQLSNEDQSNTTAEDDWKHIEDALIHSAQQIIPPKARDKKQKWMNDDIIKLMKKRRSVKNKKTTIYKELNRKIHAECRKAKEKWIEEQCEELEDLEKKNMQQMYSNIKRMSKRLCRPANTAVKEGWNSSHGTTRHPRSLDRIYRRNFL